MQLEEKFSYSAQPHAAPLAMKKSKYRNADNNDQQSPVENGLGNLMYDARVIRGNTYAARVLTTSDKDKLNLESSKKFPTKSRQSRQKAPGARVGTPPPVEGRTHMKMQTDEFIEEITDRPLEHDAETQTLPFMDRPASPLFVRAKIGSDASTQIGEGDLFDFDLEVEPLLELLVGKTLHVSMLEIMQEVPHSMVVLDSFNSFISQEELEAIRLQQEEFETLRNIEIAEVQRLEVEIKRKAQERERRIAQENRRVEEKRRLEESIAARAFSNQFLGELHNNVFDMLQEQGHFYDPVKKEIEVMFMGGLISNVVNAANSYEAASIIAKELLESARVRARAFEREAKALRKERQDRLEQERLQREEQQRLENEAAAEALRLAAAAAEGTGEGEE
eukprot:CAMPEP_0170076624 /NCGR_PEP_ID=MMETSP0019_2-20121128/13596_1 /TAXON_ID=98059 /ORGANISM="Dinobryon sp., Strain UTEXLB2267" /LENGTH=391 /DNA_ID=CAMNT_0010288449 /DNA_START=58 /DNA_END=1233 /DNA_ORIENTATION=+